MKRSRSVCGVRIAQVEAENRRSPLHRYRLEKAKKLLDSRSSTQK